MKKNLTFVFFLLGFLALVGSLPIKADEFLVTTPFPYDSGFTQEEIDESNNIGVFINYLMKGGTIDYSNSSDGYSADDLLNDFEDFFDNITSGFVDVTKKALGIKDEFKILYPLNSPWAKHGADTLISLLPGLNEPNNNNPTPNPDVDYLSYLDLINGSGFYWSNYSSTSSIDGYVYTALRYPFNEYSWVCTSNIQALEYTYTNILDYENLANVFQCLPVTINIISNNDVYYMQGTVTTYSTPIYFGYNGSYWNSFKFYRDLTYYPWYAQNQAVRYDTYTYSYSGTLAQCLNFIALKFRNVNIYVDGVLWSEPIPDNNNYSINITNGTVEPITDSPIHWQYEEEIYTDIENIKDRLQDLINRPTPSPITFPDFEDLIVDVNGQRAFAVTIIEEDTNIDGQYFDNYGPLVPIFVPLFTPIIDDVDIVNIISAPMDVIPSDILDVFGYLFIGTLFVCFIHRLLE